MTCPLCNKDAPLLQFNIEYIKLGRRVTCPTCGREFDVYKYWTPGEKQEKVPKAYRKKLRREKHALAKEMKEWHIA